MNNNKLPQIWAGEGDLRKVSDKAWDAIVRANDPPWLFRNRDRLVRIEIEEKAFMREIGLAHMKHILTRWISWHQRVKEGRKKSSRCPYDLPADILARPDKHVLPMLRRIVDVPIYTRRGTLLTDPGYNAEAKLFYSPDPALVLLPVSQNPRRVELADARNLIVSELLGDFPFTGEAEIAHAVGAMLVPLVREMIAGQTPIHLIEKPTPGTGGTLLAQALCYPAVGSLISTVTAPTEEAEWRRTLFSWLRDTPSVVLIDNLAGPLRSPTLATVLTSGRYTDRVVGESNSGGIDTDCLWIATGNNPVLSGEIARRCVRIRLDAHIERPEIGRSFRHPNLPSWFTVERPRLLWALLTIIQAWIAAGQPAGALTLGMFESWSAVVGGILQVADVPGFLLNVDDFRSEGDLDRPEIIQFLHSWWSKHGRKPVGVAELWFCSGGLDLGDGSEQSRRIKLGNKLDSLRDRCVALFRIAKVGSYQGAQQYQLIRVEEGANAKL